MVRFNSEVELESHNLGRSLLFMVRDDADGIDTLPARVPLMPTTSPFDEVRERLSAAGHAIRVMHEQVQLQPFFCTTNVDIHIYCGSFEHVILILWRLPKKNCSRFAYRSLNFVNITSSHKEQWLHAFLIHEPIPSGWPHMWVAFITIHNLHIKPCHIRSHSEILHAKISSSNAFLTMPITCAILESNNNG
jgi:hypothetical protein